MIVQDLLTHLSTTAAPEYRGEPSVEFRGLTFRSRATGARHKFFVHVDASWGKAIARRFAPDEISLEEHVSRAKKSGLAGLIINSSLRGHPALTDINCLFAEDTQHLSYRIAEVVRDNRGRRPITAITGSVGKSTTKSMLTHALTAIQNDKRLYSPPSDQNVSMSMLTHLTQVTQFDHSILEVAGSCFRRFSKQDFALAADVSVVTSISEAHLTYLGSLEGVARQKAQIFDAPPPGGVAVINIDAPHSDLLLERARSQGREVVTYGEGNNASVRLLEYEPATSTVHASVSGESISYPLGADGKHMALNSLAVIAILRAHKTEDWRAAIKSLRHFQPLKGRGKLTQAQLPSGAEVTLIDEAYNANPASMRSALEALATRPVTPNAKRIAVLGDILELGPSAVQIHEGLKDAFSEHTFQGIHLYGPNMKALHDALVAEGINCRHWKDLGELRDALLSDLKTGDTILLKSSNGTGLNQLVQQLR